MLFHLFVIRISLYLFVPQEMYVKKSAYPVNVRFIWLYFPKVMAKVTINVQFIKYVNA